MTTLTSKDCSSKMETDITMREVMTQQVLLSDCSLEIFLEIFLNSGERDLSKIGWEASLGAKLLGNIAELEVCCIIPSSISIIFEKNFRFFFYKI